jgi:hypothetical protein
MFNRKQRVLLVILISGSTGISSGTISPDNAQSDRLLRHRGRVGGSQRSGYRWVISILAHGAICFVLKRLDNSVRRLAWFCSSFMVNKACLPVRNDCQARAKNRSNPVDPVVGRETAVDNRRSKSAGWVDAGCKKSDVSKDRNEDEGC